VGRDLNRGTALYISHLQGRGEERAEGKVFESSWKEGWHEEELVKGKASFFIVGKGGGRHGSGGVRLKRLGLLGRNREMWRKRIPAAALHHRENGWKRTEKPRRKRSHRRPGKWGEAGETEDDLAIPC